MDFDRLSIDFDRYESSSNEIKRYQLKSIEIKMKNVK
jgi:hypothetical protein